MQQAVRVRRKKTETKHKKIRPTQNAPRNPQQPGDRDHLETACDEARLTRSPTLAHFHRSRVCGNRPRAAFAISTSRKVNEATRPHTCSRPCVFEEKKNRKKKNTKKSAPPKTHHESHSIQATATNSRRRAKKHVPRASPYLPASIDPGFVEIGLVQLSQSVKTTNVTHTLTDTQTHRDGRTD